MKKMKKNLLYIAASLGLFSAAAVYASDEGIWCWSVTCVVCDANGECGDFFEAPDEICKVPGVRCSGQPKQQ